MTDDDSIQALNKQFRNKDKPTNVLAFPMQEGEFSDISPALLGDLVISCETAKREAQKAGISTEERLSQLLIHGTLHLVGFDHEKNEENAKQMEEKSLSILRLIESNSELTSF